MACADPCRSAGPCDRPGARIGWFRPAQHPLAGRRGHEPLPRLVRGPDRVDAQPRPPRRRGGALHQRFLRLRGLLPEPCGACHGHVSHQHRRAPHAHHLPATRSQGNGHYRLRSGAAAACPDGQRDHARARLLRQQQLQGGLPVPPVDDGLGRDQPVRALAQPARGQAVLFGVQLRRDARGPDLEPRDDLEPPLRAGRVSAGQGPGAGVDTLPSGGGKGVVHPRGSPGTRPSLPAGHAPGHQGSPPDVLEHRGDGPLRRRHPEPVGGRRVVRRDHHRLVHRPRRPVAAPEAVAVRLGPARADDRSLSRRGARRRGGRAADQFRRFRADAAVSGGNPGARLHAGQGVRRRIRRRCRARLHLRRGRPLRRPLRHDPGGARRPVQVPEKFPSGAGAITCRWTTGSRWPPCGNC